MARSSGSEITSQVRIMNGDNFVSPHHAAVQVQVHLSCADKNVWVPPAFNPNPKISWSIGFKLFVEHASFFKDIVGFGLSK